MLAGDFKAWYMDWSVKLRIPGAVFCSNSAAGLDLVLANTRNLSTSRGTGSGVIHDLIYVNTTLARRMVWFISEHCHSVHHPDTNGAIGRLTFLRSMEIGLDP